MVLTTAPPISVQVTLKNPNQVPADTSFPPHFIYLVSKGLLQLFQKQPKETAPVPTHATN